METYAYSADGDCIIGFGDEAVFFSFTADFEPCTSGAAEAEVSPCLCAEDPAWPNVGAINLEGVASFRIQVRSNEDDAILVPDDGSDWLEISDGRIIDLNDFLPPPAVDDSVTIFITANAEAAAFPWADGEPPTLVIAPEAFRPALIE